MEEMGEKVILILVDGMRPDGLLQCGNPYVETLLESEGVFLDGRTVMPSVTLPCHMSLFHSVPPQRHGILSNTWTPQVRPIDGLFEILKQNNKVSASFYNWEQLRDLGRPGTITHSTFFSIKEHNNTDLMLTNKALSYIKQYGPDFIFLYLGNTDSVGHEFGWMGDNYKKAISNAISCIEKVIRETKGTYTYFIMADHGGHERSHGTDMPEDMNIPIIIQSKGMVPRKDVQPNIIDIAPTITRIMGISPGVDWEGKDILK